MQQLNEAQANLAGGGGSGSDCKNDIIAGAGLGSALGALAGGMASRSAVGAFLGGALGMALGGAWGASTSPFCQGGGMTSSQFFRYALR